MLLLVFCVSSSRPVTQSVIVAFPGHTLFLQSSGRGCILRETAGYFTKNVFVLSCDCPYYVSLPRGATSWSVVCDCGISWSYSHAFCNHLAEEETAGYLTNMYSLSLPRDAVSCPVVCDCGIYRSYLLAFRNHLAEKETAGYFTKNVFLLSCDCLYSASLPRGAMSWSVDCDFGIYRSYSLAFLNHLA